YADYTDYSCNSGNCEGGNATQQFQEDCDDSDGYGPNFCDGNYVLANYTDYSCNMGDCEGYVTPQIMDYCNISCSNGECVW
ncbi:MAG: hypothetical protein KAJ54_02635, partial [Candidatus Aenigmarchaeota archaeon]|nr:hypothetical protein [Candidatus Aenigmarchaeota archaeon]